MQLKLNNTIIPLFPDTNLQLVKRNPLFVSDDGKIKGSYIFNFQVPASEAIRREFGQAHAVNRHGRATAEINYELSDGSLRYTGTAVVVQASKAAYEIALKVDTGDFAGKIMDKTLKYLDFGGDKTFVDLYSCAIARNLVEGFTDFEVNSVPINAPTDIVIDFTSSLTVGGSTFTADRVCSVTQKISIHAAFTHGSLQVICKKNGVGFLDQTLSSADDYPVEINTVLNLVAADVVTVEFVGLAEDIYTGGTPDHYFQLDIFVGLVMVEYKIDNLFTLNLANDQTTSDFAVFPIYNKNFFDNYPDDAFMVDNTSIKTLYSQYYPVLNYYKDNHFPEMINGIKEGETFFVANLFTPFVYMRSILNRIVSEAGYGIVNNPFDTEDFKDMVLFNAYAENTYAGNQAALLTVKPTFNLTDHLPEMSQGDFMKNVSLLTGYMYTVDNNTRIVTFVDIRQKNTLSASNLAVAFPGKLLPDPEVYTDPEYKGIKLELSKSSTDKYQDNVKELSEKLIYKGEVEHLNDLPSSGNEINDMYLVSALQEYYVFQYNPETYTLTWWFHSKNFPLIYTEGEEPFLQISIAFSPVLTQYMLDETLNAPENRYWILPRTDQPGIFEGFPDSLSAEFGIQVLFYKGMSTDSLGNSYPLGSSRAADYATTKNCIDLSADAIFENRYKEFLRWIAYDAKPVTSKAILTRGQLQSLKDNQVYAGNGFHFLIREVRSNLRCNVDALLAEIDFYTL